MFHQALVLHHGAGRNHRRIHFDPVNERQRGRARTQHIADGQLALRFTGDGRVPIRIDDTGGYRAKRPFGDSLLLEQALGIPAFERDDRLAFFVLDQTADVLVFFKLFEDGLLGNSGRVLLGHLFVDAVQLFLDCIDVDFHFRRDTTEVLLLLGSLGELTFQVRVKLSELLL